MALALAGCSAPVEPTQREGTWRPIGSNDTNLRAMVADPAHLSQGAESSGGRGWQASQAIGRLRDDKVKSLPDVRASRVGPAPSTGPGR
ncbi:hypothetical protein STHU_21650 [Allostella humosa]|nr:hypothetical protein STHU_21650 [Stella humosa]